MAERIASLRIEIFPDHEFWRRDLFPKVGTGLEERVLKIFAEAVPGTHAVLIGSAAFTQMAGLEELLVRVPPRLGARLAVMADPGTVQRLRERGSMVPIFEDPMEAVIHLGSMAGLESVTYVGPGREGPMVLQHAQALRLPFRPPVSLSGVTGRKLLLILGQALGIERAILQQNDLADLEELRQAA